MSRLPMFNSPLLLGFDHFERLLDRATKNSNDTYPPYNIEQTSENSLRITLAVAGFSMENLTVSLEDNQLIVSGHQAEEETQRVFIHRGIAARQFQRSFVLAEGIEVNAANLDHGLLHIDLDQPKPTPRIREIPIQSNRNQQNTAISSGKGDNI